MATPRIQWIQYNELVLGENNPTGEPDNDNRPLKQIVIFSNLNPQADDFPGFIGCYQGTSDPNGVQVGNVRNSFWDAANGEFWMKQTGDNTNTGWIKIGGIGGDHLIGNGSPDSSRVADHVGKYYDQLDSDGEHPSWVKRSRHITVELSREWFNGINDTDISGRTVDGGGSAPHILGVWAENTGAASGNINLVTSSAVPTFAGVNCYNLTGITGLTVNQYAAAVIVKQATVPNFLEVGVGVRFATAAMSGYIATVRLDTGELRVYKYVAGTPTSLGSIVATRAFDSNDPWNCRIELRAFDVGATTNLELWWNGRLVVEVSDATYYGVIGTPALFANDVGQFNVIYQVPEFYAGSTALTDDDTGWYGQNGFEYNNCLRIGSLAVAEDYAIGNVVGSIAIGYQSHAAQLVQSSHSFASLAVGHHAEAIGDGNIAIGSNAIAVSDLSTAIGADASARAYASLAIGSSANVYDESGIAIGQADCGGQFAIALGDGATCYGNKSISIGNLSFVDGSIEEGISLGYNGGVEAIGGIALGSGAIVNTSHDYSIAVNDANTTLAHQLMVGGTTGYIENIVFGNGGAHNPPKSVVMRITNASGANIAGSTFTIAASLGTGTGVSGTIVFQTGTPGSTGSTLQTLATRLTVHNTGITVSGNTVNSINVLAYSVSITPNAALGKLQVVTVTDAVAFAMNAPTNPIAGQELTFVIRNTSGGAVGAITWNAVFKMAAFVTSATGFSRSITFYYNGTNWVEISKIVTDVPN